jgi:hypothetical protein
MVWAAIGYNYKLIFIEGNLNADGYIELLQTNGIFDDIKKAFGEKPVYFQQDGAPAHTAKRTKNFIKDQIDIINNWPPNPCDLSPIEQLWAIIKAKLGIREPKSLQELRIMIIEEYNKIEINVINKLIAGIPKRMEICLANDGKQIGHLLRNLSSKIETSENCGNKINPNDELESNLVTTEPSLEPQIDSRYPCENNAQIIDENELESSSSIVPPVITITEITSKDVSHHFQIFVVVSRIQNRNIEYGNRHCLLCDAPTLKTAGRLPHRIAGMYHAEIMNDVPCGTVLKIEAIVILLPEQTRRGRKWVFEIALHILRIEPIAFGVM